MVKAQHTNVPIYSSVHPELVLLIGAVVLLALYPLVRYGGFWGEVDTSAATQAIRAMYDTGALVPAAPLPVYPNGYGYQVIAVFLMHISGLSLPALHLIGSSLLMGGVFLPAWLLGRELTGTPRGATLSTLLLLVQPEFLFVISRGTHEKFTRFLMLLFLWLVVASIRARGRPVRLTGMLVSLYLAGYAIISLNNLLSTSFILATLMALLIALATSRYDRALRVLATPTVEKLSYVVAVLLLFAFLFTFFAYPPARNQLSILKDIGERVAALVLNTGVGAEDQSVINPYTKWVGNAWINLPTYFLVSLANWLLLGGSLAVWCWYGVRWLAGRWRPQNHGELLLWSLYGAFAFQGFASIGVDISGAIDGNLQHRIFPSFAMCATPLLAWWLTRLPLRIMSRPWAAGSLAALLMTLAMLSALKATNEPALSNKWQFYIPSELRALDWAETALPQRTIWTEYDERLVVADNIRRGGLPRGILLDRSEPNIETRDFLISDITRARDLRLQVPLPIEADSLIVYDNGQAQVYHLRPRTPYQP